MTSNQIAGHRRAARRDTFRRLQPLDILLLLLVVLISGAAAWSSRGEAAGASEDGSMLLRYSQHLADHQGIVWNVGQAPVEGATDFLYMAAVAGAARLTGQSAYLACRDLLFICWLALAATVFLACRITLNSNRWLALGLALYVCSAAEGSYLKSFFGAPFMMLMVALAWWAGIAILTRKRSVGWSASLLFSLLALLIGLTRPEGNVLALLLLGSIVYLHGVRQSLRLIVAFAGVFVLLGGGYFLWRWHYFGYLLPNPFYVKGGGHLHLNGLLLSTENAIKILWPALPVAALALRTPTRRRLLAGLLIPVVGFTLVWVLLSPENNHLMRFQMPLLPVVLLFIPLLLEDLGAELEIPWQRLSSPARFGIRLAMVFYMLASCAIFYKTFNPPNTSNAKEIAEHLSRYADRGYTMAVTEAGQFPYFSRWNAIDALGLNDAHIAHLGFDEAYLDESKPELILYHLYPTPAGGFQLHGDSSVPARDLHAITVLHSYAIHHRYVLAAAYGSDPCSLNVFYVRPDTSDTDAIVRYLRETPYYFLDTGMLSTDFRDGFRPECHLPELLPLPTGG